ncbi:hypothetical protein [Actinokineospora diospyrosa]|uniref:Uncharacterized protein n=1 Tax=Actinokineospora diospyrosa TaxID=103728 RepID=A0ABT1I7K9_9PSEU|nr:hypothetical protein [Actinokineospora diospyrosa]MCP2268607.1 hypothetical protein [Actinokineospora diospyrosa]
MRFALGAAVLALLLAVSGCQADEPDPVAAQDKVVTDYLAALTSGEVERVRSLAVRGSDDPAEAERRVEAFGGPVSDVRITWRRGEFPDVAVATITATRSGQPVTDRVTVSKDGDRWGIVLGATNPVKPPANTGTPPR